MIKYNLIRSNTVVHLIVSQFIKQPLFDFNVGILGMDLINFNIDIN